MGWWMMLIIGSILLLLDKGKLLEKMVFIGRLKPTLRDIYDNARAILSLYPTYIYTLHTLRMQYRMQ